MSTFNSSLSRKKQQTYFVRFAIVAKTRMPTHCPIGFDPRTTCCLVSRKIDMRVAAPRASVQPQHDSTWGLSHFFVNTFQRCRRGIYPHVRRNHLQNFLACYVTASRTLLKAADIDTQHVFLRECVTQNFHPFRFVILCILCCATFCPFFNLLATITIVITIVITVIITDSSMARAQTHLAWTMNNNSSIALKIEFFFSLSLLPPG